MLRSLTKRGWRDHIASLVRQADAGEVSAMTDLALNLFEGIQDRKGRSIVRRNSRAAVAWFRQAANCGNSTAASSLGYAYNVGLGVKRNVAQAIRWYRQAARLGDSTATYNLATVYRDAGKAVLAFHWWERAADMRDGEAAVDVGYCYQYGIGTGKNTANAKRMFRRAIASKDISQYGREETMYHLAVQFIDEGKRHFAFPLLRRAAADDDFPEAASVLNQLSTNSDYVPCRCKRFIKSSCAVTRSACCIPDRRICWTARNVPGTGTRKIMRMWIVALGVLVFVTPSGRERVEAASSSMQLVSRSESALNEKAVLKYLWPALDYGARASRIYYRGNCKPDAYPDASFPQLDAAPPSKGRNGVAAVRDVFRREKHVSIKEADPGIIRVRIGSVPDAVLRVRISSLVLTPEEQYNYWPAIFKIQNAPEVQSAMRELKIRIPARTISIGIAQPADGLPRLPGVLTNVTMDQALDLVAKTFKGIVLYGFCTPPDQYQIDFADAGYIYSTN